ncbi:MAG: hypothetical protein WAN44_01265 [Propionibacteriaceae bacterium]
MTAIGALQLDIDHFRARILQDALTEATAGCWIHRAYQFLEAAPRKGDFHGTTNADELWERWSDCMNTALACRRRAQLIIEGRPEEISSEVLVALEEVAPR